MVKHTQSIFTFLVVEEDHATRLDKALMKGAPSLPSRAFGAKLIEQGFVKVDGVIEKKASYVLKKGQKVEVDLSLLEQEKEGFFTKELTPSSFDFTILFEDDDILVIDKPANLVVHPGAGNRGHTLVQSLYAYFGYPLPSLGGQERSGIIHRLDKDTSGVMVIAKSQLALTSISKQFASHTKKREYLALCYNTPQAKQGMIETFHGRDQKNRLKFAVVEEGKVAKLAYKVVETFQDGRYSLIRCELFTGRTHQIRVQLEHIGCPILGDKLYVKGRKLRHHIKEQSLETLASRQMLHATLLEFTHPRSLESVCFESSLPSDFTHLLNMLKENR
jgi:23S rRNA pseudouridine1911/1915/1917 synthase